MQLMIFILNFVKLTEKSVIRLKIILSCHHQLEKAGDFLPDRKYSVKCHGKQSNNILKAFLEPSSLGSYLISFIFAFPKDLLGKLSTLRLER